MASAASGTKTVDIAFSPSSLPHYLQAGDKSSPLALFRTFFNEYCRSHCFLPGNPVPSPLLASCNKAKKKKPQTVVNSETGRVTTVHEKPPAPLGRLCVEFVLFGQCKHYTPFKPVTIVSSDEPQILKEDPKKVAELEVAATSDIVVTSGLPFAKNLDENGNKLSKTAKRKMKKAAKEKELELAFADKKAANEATAAAMAAAVAAIAKTKEVQAPVPSLFSSSPFTHRKRWSKPLAYAILRAAASNGTPAPIEWALRVIEAAKEKKK